MAIVPEAVGKKKNYTALLLLISDFCLPNPLLLARCSLLFALCRVTLIA
jgi:hypothetical protein